MFYAVVVTFSIVSGYIRACDHQEFCYMPLRPGQGPERRSLPWRAGFLA